MQNENPQHSLLHEMRLTIPMVVECIKYDALLPLFSFIAQNYQALLRQTSEGIEQRIRIDGSRVAQQITAESVRHQRDCQLAHIIQGEIDKLLKGNAETYHAEVAEKGVARTFKAIDDRQKYYAQHSRHKPLRR